MTLSEALLIVFCCCGTLGGTPVGGRRDPNATGRRSSYIYPVGCGTAVLERGVRAVRS